ncbi:MAG: ATP-binding protein [Burkholderiaceae bacterium]
MSQLAPTVCLLGGESTGKSTLARDLHRHLRGIGVSAVLVPEHLRAWCEQRGRAPLAHEQADLAATQHRLIDSARRQPGVDLVLADTSGLMVAVYSELYFDDASLYPGALAHQSSYDLTLLMGLDLPWVADGLFRDSPAIRQATDVALRRELSRAGLPFHTVYGQGQDRMAAALRPMHHGLAQGLGRPLAPPPAAGRPRASGWVCDRCSDPECEHRLFSRLMASRRTDGNQ